MSKNAITDIILLTSVGVLAFLLSGHFDALEAFIDYSEAHEDWELDEILSTAFVLVFVLLGIMIKREQELRLEVKRRILAEARLSELAYEDPLTGLPNRRFFMRTLASAIEQATRHNSLQAVLFIDIDNFKEVNDSFGHIAGDKLLIQLSQRLSQCIRSEDMFARIAGDEFVALLNNVKGPEDAAVVARKLIQLSTSPALVGSNKVSISLSIGIAITPIDSTSAEELMSFADEAMYRVKNQGKNSYHFFNQDFNSEQDMLRVYSRN